MSSPSTRIGRFEHVDLLRGIAAFTVLVAHYQAFYGPARDISDLTFYILLAPFYLFGGLAVQLFWVISGFVFSAVYSNTCVDSKLFTIRRFARLYPLHFFTLIIVAIIQAYSFRQTGSYLIYTSNDVPRFIAQLFFASNWLPHQGYSFNAPIWSISAEIIGYGIFLVYIRRFDHLRSAVVLAVTGWVLDALIDWPVAQCTAFFFAGVIAFKCRERLMCSWALLVAWIAGGALICALSILAAHRITAAYSAAILLMPAIVLTAAKLDAARSVAQGLHWIGDITYALYLTHTPIIMTMLLLGFTPSPSTLALYVIVTVLISIVTYRMIELPAQQKILFGFLRFRTSRRLNNP